MEPWTFIDLIVEVNGVTYKVSGAEIRFEHPLSLPLMIIDGKFIDPEDWDQLLELLAKEGQM